VPIALQRPKSPRRKPKQARAHETVDVVFEAAARVLRDQGYARATTNRIAEAAGVSVGTVYEYFAGKDAIFEELIRRELAGLVRSFEDAGLGEGDDLETTIRRLIDAGMAAMGHGPELFRGLESVPGAKFRRRLAGAREVVIELVVRMLAAHEDEIGEVDRDLAAFVVVGAIEGVGTNGRQSQFDERLAVEITRLVTRYLRGG